MKKLLSALFLGLFLAVSAPVILHADDAAAAGGAADTKDTAPKKAHKAKKHRKAKKKAKHMSKAADAAPKDASAGGDKY